MTATTHTNLPRILSMLLGVMALLLAAGCSSKATQSFIGEEDEIPPFDSMVMEVDDDISEDAMEQEEYEYYDSMDAVEPMDGNMMRDDATQERPKPDMAKKPRPKPAPPMPMEDSMMDDGMMEDDMMIDDSVMDDMMTIEDDDAAMAMEDGDGGMSDGGDSMDDSSSGGGLGWWWLLILLVVAGAGYGVYRARSSS